MSGYSTVSGNELSSDGTSDYTYDATGNMTSKTNIATGVETDYVWDDRNRLVEVDQVISGVNTVLALYTYDALNNPIKVVEGGSTRWTVYDGNRPVLDFERGVESRSGAVAEAPFPLPAHRTGRADFPHPALGQGPTCGRSREAARTTLEPDQAQLLVQEFLGEP